MSTPEGPGCGDEGWRLGLYNKPIAGHDLRCHLRLLPLFHLLRQWFMVFLPKNLRSRQLPRSRVVAAMAGQVIVVDIVKRDLAYEGTAAN